MSIKINGVDEGIFKLARLLHYILVSKTKEEK